MAAASYMDFFGYRFQDGSTPERGTVQIDYRVKYDAPVVTAAVQYVVGDGRCDYHITDLGRKFRASKAEQERVWEILRVAGNYRALFAKNGNASHDFRR